MIGYRLHVTCPVSMIILLSVDIIFVCVQGENCALAFTAVAAAVVLDRLAFALALVAVIRCGK